MATTENSGRLSVPFVTPGELYAASIVFPFLGIVFTPLRFYAKTLQKNSIGLDDWLMLPTLILLIGMGVCLLIGVNTKAIGYSLPLIENLEQFTNGIPIAQLFGKIGYVYQILVALEFGVIKLSFTLYYRRIFVVAKGFLFDWITKAAITIVVIWTVVFVFALIFLCGPHIFANWRSSQDARRYCPGSFPITRAFVVSDLITDVLVLCLPLPIVWTMQMSTKKRLIVTGIFATGAVSIIASIIKVIISFEILNASINIDPYRAISTMLYWSMIEGGLAVIAVSLPTLRIVVGTVSLSSIRQRLRSALRWNSVHSQDQELQQISRRFPSRSEESCPQIDADSASFTFGAARETNKNPIRTSTTGSPNHFSEPITGQFSQHTSIV